VTSVLSRLPGRRRKSGDGPTGDRQLQLAYSDSQSAMHDEAGRRAKAAKIIAVTTHFLGRSDLAGLTALDLGSSTGFIADELRRAGAMVIGLDIDEPGLTAARRRFPAGILWMLADGTGIPLPDRSVDLVVFNQIYEHVVDPDAVMAEIRRVLKPEGVAYLGLGNRLTLWEPHVRLPFASWLPAGLADHYVRAAGRGDAYYERFRLRRGLRRMVGDLAVWDYTWTVIAEPDRFAARDIVRGAVAKLPVATLRLLAPVVPTYIWLATPGHQSPRGGPVVREPALSPPG
jgi:SAM-dependent methyltransferase